VTNAKERFVTVGRQRLWVSTCGEGPPLLLIMGFGGNTSMWAPLRRHLPGFQTIAYDSPGTGHSAPSSRPVLMKGLARVAMALLDELGVERCAVLGYSFGGAVAQEIALHSPDRVDRLVLAATSSGVGSLPGCGTMWLTNPSRYYLPWFAQAIGPWIYGGRQRQGLVAPGFHSAPPSLGAYYGQALAMATWTSLPWLQRITAPTLVLAGDDDPLVPVIHARLLARRIPDAQLQVLHGAGHLFLLDSPERVVPLLGSFLAAGGEEQLASEHGRAWLAQAPKYLARDEANDGQLRLDPELLAHLRPFLAGELPPATVPVLGMLGAQSSGGTGAA